MSALLTSEGFELPRTIELSVRVYGRSMRPWLRAGSTVRVEIVAYDELECGDIVWFPRAETSVLHRIVLRDALTGLWVTRGDAQRGHDGPLARDMLIGRVRGLAIGRLLVPGAPSWLTCSVNRSILVLCPLTRALLRTWDRCRHVLHEHIRRSKPLTALRALLRGAHRLQWRTLGRDDVDRLHVLFSRAWAVPNAIAAAIWVRALTTPRAGAVVGVFRGNALVAAARWPHTDPAPGHLVSTLPNEVVAAPGFQSLLTREYVQTRLHAAGPREPTSSIPSVAAA